jgi:AraC-like DNA-binding protein
MNFYQQQLEKLHTKLYAKPLPGRQVMAAKAFMVHRFDEDIGLEHIAAAGHCSPYHFIRLFNRYYGQTPHQYLRALRIGRAKVFLAQGFSIRSACYASGFSSSTSFSMLFKKLTGQTPREFQKTQF